jgi:uncharacterized protein YoxC
MTQAMTWAGAWLLQRSIALQDTIVTKQVESVPSSWDRITSIASGLLTIAFLVFVVAAVPALWNFRKSYRRINHLLERIYGDINPIMRHASAIADNVDYVTTAIRTDVQQIQATIATANSRLQQAVALTERRLNDMSALMEVVQQEAEQAFLSTASAVRGVRRGASALSGNDDGAKFARRGEDDLDRLDMEDEVETEEDMSDDYDRNAAPAADDNPRPRVRPRSRRSGSGGTERPRSL